jgi:hypothetical protein
LAQEGDGLRLFRNAVAYFADADEADTMTTNRLALADPGTAERRAGR